MSTLPLRPLRYGDELTLTGHLGELRTRLLVCAATLALAFAGCLWQSPALLKALNRPLATIKTPATATTLVSRALARSGGAFAQLAHSPTLSPADRRAA